MSDKFYTSRLLQKIDSYKHNGVDKCMLYTEINTNINVGDMVYITNGILDNEKIIEKRNTDRYSKYVNGFKVLYADKCKIAIDYNYNNSTYQSFLSDGIEKYLNVYVIKNHQEMVYNNSIYTDMYINRTHKFQYGLTNNFIYIESSNVILDIITNTDIIFNKIDQTTNTIVVSDVNNYMEFEESFYVFTGNNTYININAYFDNNEFDTYFSSEYQNLANIVGYLNNGKIIFNNDIIYKDLKYKKDNPYKHTINDSGIGKWEIDIEYKTPIISKLNFKKGHFSGKHNDGLFGNYDKQLKWDHKNEWNSGFMVNTLWENGIMDSKSTVDTQSYYSYEENGTISESTDFTNNKGFGYNFIEDSVLTGGTIANGNFNNCIIDGGISNNVVRDYINNNIIVSNINFNNGKISSSLVDNIAFSKGELNNSIVNNTLLDNTNMVNSEFNNCVASGSYNSSNSIKVFNAKIFSFIKNSSQTTNIEDISSILRLYVSDRDYNKLSYSKSFTISKLNKDYYLNSSNLESSIILPIETKYILDKYYNNNVTSSDVEIICSIKNSIDNRYNRSVKKVSGTNFPTDPYLFEQINELNTNVEYSIDIELGIDYAYFMVDLEDTNYYVKDWWSTFDKIEFEQLFTNTLIENGSFGKGIIRDTIIEHGDFINTNNMLKYIQLGINLGGSPYYGNNLHGTISGNNIMLGIYNLNKNLNEKLNIGDTVWISELIYQTPLSSYDFKGRYTIVSININSEMVTLKPDEQSLVDTINMYNQNPSSGNFRYKSDTAPTFLGLHSRAHINNTFKSGLFIGEYVENGLFENDDFDNSDKNLTPSNIQLLRVSKVSIPDSTVNSGLFTMSYFKNTNWNNGIIYNSIWHNEYSKPFKNGCIVNSIWKDGVFDNGVFYNNNAGFSIIGFSGYERFAPQHINLNYVHTSHQWVDGIFNNGTFEDSYFKDGTFNGGKFFNSSAYSGIFNGGIIGDKSYSYTNTILGAQELSNLTINGAVVENALIGGDGTVIWENGTFNGGVLTSCRDSAYNGGIFPTMYNTYTFLGESHYNYTTHWKNGTFNGGKVTGGVIWENGTFNGGSFEPKPQVHYDNNNTVNGPNNIVFNWLDGTFNGGTFGSHDNIDDNYITPSWENGTFNGGTFLGRVWKNGTFTAGTMRGTSDFQFVKNNKDILYKVISEAVGTLWINGKVSDSNYDTYREDGTYIRQRLKRDTSSVDNSVSIENVLWMDGEHNHKTSIMNNVTWINGVFKNGTMKNSIFNPKIDENPYLLSVVPTYNPLDSCRWEGGKLVNSIFNISKWYNGESISNTLNGAIWLDGIFNGGVANNILWKNGIWKNGIWNGSYFNKNNRNAGINDDSVAFMDNINSNGNTFVDSSDNNTFHINNILFENYNYYNLMSLSRHISIGFFRTGRLPMNQYPSLDTNGGTELDWVQRLSPLNSPPNPNSSYNGIPYSFKVMGMKPGQKSKMLNIGSKLNTFDLLTNPNVEYYLFFKVKYDIVALDNNGFPILTTTYNNINFDGEIRLYLDIEQLMDGSRKTVKFFPHCTSPINYDSDGRPFIKVKATESKFRIPINVSDMDTLKTINFSTKFMKPILATGIELGPNYTSIVTLSQSNNELDQTALVPYLSILQVRYRGDSNKLFSNFPVSMGYLNNLGNDYTFTYGNGQFLKGLWENGTWNSGFRNDENNVAIFRKLEYHSRFDDYNHYIYLSERDLVSTDMIELSVGDKVSIGNIIGIDINGNRVIIDGVYNITSITEQGDLTKLYAIKIVCKDVVKSISMDSSEHFIKVSNNIWLNGKIVTGRFVNTVLNNVQTDGDNYNLILDYVNIINGNINGGTINTTGDGSTYSNRLRINASNTRPNLDGIVGSLDINAGLVSNVVIDTPDSPLLYSNGIPAKNSKYIRSLIQNSIINDKYYIDQSVSEGALQHHKNVKFKTILNLQYPSTERIDNGTAEGSYSNLYFGSQTDKSYSNRGRVTYDVLSSVSYIYNPLNKKVEEHNLGMKYTLYENVIPNGGNFENELYKSNPSPINSNQDFNQNFDLDGWRVVSNDIGTTSITSYAIGSNVDGIDSINSTQYYLDISNQPTSTRVSSNDRMVIIGSRLVLSNAYSYVDYIPRKRYTMIDVTFGDDYYLGVDESLITDSTPNGIPQLENKKSYGIHFNYKHPLLDLNLYENEATAITLGKTKRIKEYFYDSNRMNVSLVFNNLGPQYSDRHISFENISYYEVDMIPFFKYYGPDNINRYYTVPKYDTNDNNSRYSLISPNII